LIDPILASHGGRIVDLKGDGAMVEFHSVVAAVEAAVAVQRSMVEHEAGWPEDERIRFRIGITSGDVIVEGEEIFGQHMNVAARIQAMCEPGGVWLSGPVHNLIRGKLALDCESMGLHQVKNIGEPVEAWRVRLSTDSEAPQADRRATVGLSRRFRAVAAVAIMLILAIGAWRWLGPEPAAAGKPSIAVLPFDNLSGDAEQGFLADGFAEDLITELARNGELRVMARNTSFSFRGQPMRIEDIARKLSVSYVLEGSIRRVGDDMRLTAQLIDGRTGTHVWAERYDIGPAEIVATQDEIVLRVAAILFSEVRQTEKRQALRSPPDSFDAYTLALKGLALKHQFTPEAYREGRRVLQRAIELAPNYAPAYAYLGYLDAADCAAGYSGEKRPEDIDAAIGLIRRALHLDPSMAYAYQALGFALSVKGSAREALVAEERAVQLGPGDADNQMLYGRELATNGRFAEAVTAGDKAFALNPIAPVYYYAMHARSLYGGGDYAGVLTTTAPCLERNSGHRACRTLRAAALVEMDRLDEAKAEIEALLARGPGFTLHHAEIYTGFAGDAVTNRRLVDALQRAGLPAGDSGSS
jgi:adenylate cyclase